MLPVQNFFHCSYVQETRFTRRGKKRLGWAPFCVGRKSHAATMH